MMLMAVKKPAVLLLVAALSACVDALPSFSVDGGGSSDSKQFPADEAADGVPGGTKPKAPLQKSQQLRDEPAAWEIALTSKPAFAVVAGGLTVSMEAQSCGSQSVYRWLVCTDPEITVASAGQDRGWKARPGMMFVARKAPVLRGPIRNVGSSDHSIILGDLDGDGDDDLLVWTGQDGLYGGPSFSAYMFHEPSGEFRIDEDFSNLTVGGTLLSAAGGRIKVGGKDGCCLHFDLEYVVESGHPTLTTRVVEDSSGGVVTLTTERLVDGKMKVVSVEER